jgi:hypothetical protein
MTDRSTLPVREEKWYGGIKFFCWVLLWFPASEAVEKGKKRWAVSQLNKLKNENC